MADSALIRIHPLFSLGRFSVLSALKDQPGRWLLFYAALLIADRAVVVAMIDG